MNLSSRQFLIALIAIFFGAVGIDVAQMAVGLNANLVRVGIYIISAALLVMLLHDRLRQLRMNPFWAILGIVPPIGLLFGIYIYVSPPNLCDTEGFGD
jgi:uncharacterized membrane protein YhaH (DUF805 family)